MPRVAVIIPAYNCAGQIPVAISSALSQTRVPDEVWVVNDGSPDTPELEAALLPFRGRMSYVFQKNGGPSSARNAAISRTTCELLAFLDADDWWDPRFLQVQCDFLTSKGLTMVYCDSALVGETGKIIGSFMQHAPSYGAVDARSLIVEQSHVITSCVVVRRDAVLGAGMFDPTKRRAEDFHLWIKMALRNEKIDYHRQILGFRNMSPGGLSSDKAAFHIATLKVYEDLLAMPVPDDLLQDVKRMTHELRYRLEIGNVKEDLAAGSYDAASLALGRAMEHKTNFKLRALQACLTFAPSFTRFALNNLRRS